jgi:CRP/FNR family cyclic AMP-dependent transcriptional regulator
VRVQGEKERVVSDRDVVKWLSEVPLFSELSRKELAALARNAKEVHHRSGAVLAREGESGLGFFLIVDGTATVSVSGKARRKMGPGDFFGEISLLDNGPRSATVTADTPVQLVGLTQWNFKRMVESSPAIATKMLKTMASRLRAASRDVTH